MSSEVTTSQSVFCRQCGIVINRDDKYCSACGAKQFVDVDSRIEKIPGPEWPSRGVAIVLALFFGGIGLHKFYLKQYGLGVIYALFCWTFIPALLGVIEALGYLTFSDEDFRNKCAEELQPYDKTPPGGEPK